MGIMNSCLPDGQGPGRCRLGNETRIPDCTPKLDGPWSWHCLKGAGGARREEQPSGEAKNPPRRERPEEGLVRSLPNDHSPPDFISTKGTLFFCHKWDFCLWHKLPEL
ncbi:uncharacterized protein LOC130454037 isoform X3 [Monodelphis domestica]|uniref:uncharacterized protein LOC130454037 isoform X3 n=1 Tax=Monodelphis domestica TaxID=13616 RepID=UPI0024E26C8D|nr:uncharacterized protein LOC130454037 isoform X3 [Monodelphis domestica]